MRNLVPVFKPQLPTVRYVEPLLRRIDQNRLYTNFGPLAEEYKERLAEYLGTNPRRVVLVSSATQGIQGLLSVLRPKAWRVPDFGFAAAGLAVRNAGLKLCLNDVSLSSWMSHEFRPTGKEGAILVLPFGRKIGTTTAERQPHTIIDAAASLGEVENGVDWLDKTSAICFSLHATKVLGAGEGGAVICGNDEMATQLTRWTNFGFQDRVSHSTGTNAKFSELHAAYALASLDSIEVEMEEWLSLRAWVRNESSGLGLPVSVHDDPNLYNVNPYWLIRLENEQALLTVSAALAAQGFDSRKWWPRPLSKMPAFSGEAPRESNTNSSELSGSILGLPFFRGLALDTVIKISATVAKALQL